VRIEFDYSVVSREGVNLRIPVSGVHDRPGRKQQHRRLASAERLLRDADAGLLDVALLIGLLCSQMS
jgi:hypothetical protein